MEGEASLGQRSRGPVRDAGNRQRLFHQTGDRHSEAAGLACLAETHRAATHADAAREPWTRALEITHELGLPDADPLRTRILGLLGRPRSPDRGRSLFSPYTSQVPSSK
ncbi:hypothetical protein [Streptomyces sp. WM6378]|uniref:hypothetical protein n=1 Tax=Streptomyces sp. WM6378 TaxID=1415557 RepID=UPI0006AF823E|nr:hypothetical protein [Streptomyces sp. WM6378]KOU36210.1 hypothetical protein ADK54_34790 [Streptomyces sp. WM6378]